MIKILKKKLNAYDGFLDFVVPYHTGGLQSLTIISFMMEKNTQIN